jgi:hypothetical protein
MFPGPAIKVLVSTGPDRADNVKTAMSPQF